MELGIEPLKALLAHHLAPLKARRDIAMLGLPFRVVNGLALPQLKELFTAASPPAYPRGWAHTMIRHGHQLLDPIDGTHTRALERSAFGLIHVWNLLPPDVVELQTVHLFQRCLQGAVKRAAQSGFADWPDFLRIGPRRLGPTQFRNMFRSSR